MYGSVKYHDKWKETSLYLVKLSEDIICALISIFLEHAKNHR